MNLTEMVAHAKQLLEGLMNHKAQIEAIVKPEVTAQVAPVAAAVENITKTMDQDKADNSAEDLNQAELDKMAAEADAAGGELAKVSP